MSDPGVRLVAHSDSRDLIRPDRRSDKARRSKRWTEINIWRSDEAWTVEVLGRSAVPGEEVRQAVTRCTTTEES